MLAIGGAVAYAQKKRGGELTVEGFKKTFRELFNSLGVNKSASSTRRSEMRRDEEMPGSYGRTGSSPRSSYGDDFTSGPNGTGRPR